MSTKSALASTSKLKGRKKTKQEEEEERLAKEAADAAALAASLIPPSPFDRIDEVWALDGQFAAQRALVGQIFEVEDGPGICIQALTLDDIYAHIHFARSIGLNNEQAKAFFGIMTTLKSHVCDSRLTMEDAFQSFKESVLGNSAVVRGKQPTPPPTDVPAIAIAPTTPTSSRAPGSASGARPTSSKGTERPNSRGKESSRTGGKSGTVTPRVGEEPTTVPAPPPAPILPRTFSVPIMKQITEYATRTYFQHWRLYRAVFDATQFRPRRHLLVERLRVETVVPDSFRLDDAVDLGQVRADTAAAIAASAAAAAAVAAASESDSKEEKEDGESFGGSRPDTAAAGTPSDLDTPLPDDELSQLVHQHVRKARQQFRALLDANEAQMDARLRAVEQRLAAANNPAGANSTTKSASTKKK